MLAVEFIYFLKGAYKNILVILFKAIAVLSVKRFIELNDQDTSVKDFFAEHKSSIAVAESLFVHERVRQDLVFELIKYNYKKATLVKEIPGENEFFYFGPMGDSLMHNALACLGDGN